MRIFSLWAWLFPVHLYQSNVAAAVVGGAVIGGVASNMAAGDAADAQTEAAGQSNATQRYMYDQTRKDNASFLGNGTSANNRLAFLLGVGGGATGGGGAQYVDASSGVPQRNEVLYASDPNYRKAWDEVAQMHNAQYHTGYTADSDANWVDQQLRQRLGEPAPQNNADFGSLLRKFTTADLNADPVYQSGLQFGLNEGEKGINNQASATGMQLSGATLKALTRYGNDYGSTKANDSRNRFVADQDSTFNRLAGISGSGQTASAQVGSAGQVAAGNISQNQVGVGNARAASAIAGANGINNAIGTGINAYQTNRLLSGLSNNTGYGNFLSNNSGILNQGLTPNDLYGAA